MRLIVLIRNDGLVLVGLCIEGKLGELGGLTFRLGLSSI